MSIDTRAEIFWQKVGGSEGREGSGTAHWNTRFSEKEVSKIRRLYASGRYTQQALAHMFNTNQAYVSQIIRRVARARA